MNIKTLCGVVFLVTSASAHAQYIISPTAVQFNDAGQYAPGDLDNVYNQSGLSSGFTSGVTNFDSYVGTNPTHTTLYSGYEWFSTEGVNSGSIIFDLGGEHILSGVALWNEEFSGLQTVQYLTSTDLNTFQAAGLQNPTNNPLNVNYGADVHLFSARTARYVLLEMTGPQDGFQYDGLSMGEIAFRGEAVPEPATMTLLGLGALAALRRRNKA